MSAMGMFYLIPQRWEQPMTTPTRPRKMQPQLETIKSGVYVYTFPSLLWLPTIPKSGRTLMKVGKSDKGPIKRVIDQSF